MDQHKANRFTEMSIWDLDFLEGALLQENTTDFSEQPKTEPSEEQYIDLYSNSRLGLKQTLDELKKAYSDQFATQGTVYFNLELQQWCSFIKVRLAGLLENKRISMVKVAPGFESLQANVEMTKNEFEAFVRAYCLRADIKNIRIVSVTETPNWECLFQYDCFC